eukprot:1191437-Prorocentrum_minimum.AAC.1
MLGYPGLVIGYPGLVLGYHGWVLGYLDLDVLKLRDERHGREDHHPDGNGVVRDDVARQRGEERQLLEAARPVAQSVNSHSTSSTGRGCYTCDVALGFTLVM